VRFKGSQARIEQGLHAESIRLINKRMEAASSDTLNLSEDSPGKVTSDYYWKCEQMLS